MSAPEMTDGPTEPIERYGSVEAWAKELGIPLKQLLEHLGNPSINQIIGSAAMRRAIADLLEIKQKEKERTLQQIRDMAKTPLNLICIPSSSKNSPIKLKSIGLRSWKELATFVGIEGNLWNCYKTRVQLAALVFGEDHPDVAFRIEEEREVSKKPEDSEGPVVAKWIDAVKKKYPDGKSWLAANITINEQPPYACPEDESGIGNYKNAIKMLCRRFNFDVTSLSYDKKVKCKLGLKIYGVQDPDLTDVLNALHAREQALQKLRDDMSRNPENVREQVLQKFRTVDDLLGRMSVGREEIFPGITIEDLCNIVDRPICGISGWEHMATVAQWLYGKEEMARWQQEETERQQEKNIQMLDASRKFDASQKRAALKTAVLKLIPYSYQWVNMQWQKRKVFRANNIDLDTIAITFDIPIPPTVSERHHLLLGQEFFGKEDPTILSALQELDENGRVSHVKTNAIDAKATNAGNSTRQPFIRSIPPGMSAEDDADFPRKYNRPGMI